YGHPALALRVRLALRGLIQIRSRRICKPLGHLSVFWLQLAMRGAILGDA
ncbi:MAG: hypothetical protein ACI9CB_001269, partial [Rhodothermales bacterium]